MMSAILTWSGGQALRDSAAYERIHEILRDIEREWSTELRPKDFIRLKNLLLRAWKSVLIR